MLTLSPVHPVVWGLSRVLAYVVASVERAASVRQQCCVLMLLPSMMVLLLLRSTCLLLCRQK